MSTGYLQHCHDRFEVLVATACSAGDEEDALGAIHSAAHYAWFHHPGRFVDHRLEALAVAIGRRLANPPPDSLVAPIRRELEPKTPLQHQRRILHVFSQALVIGGHTKLVMAWIRNDRTSQHSVVLCSQEWQPFREDFEPLVRWHGGGFVQFPPEVPRIDRVAALRTAARPFDLVVLHVHPDDPIPVAAFADEHLPPVAFLDHADHCFWLGSSITDLSIHLRGFAADLARRRRQRDRVAILPIPTDFATEDLEPMPAADRHARRRHLGLDAERCLLSVGTGYKWAPNGDVDFFGQVAELFARVPKAELHVFGLAENELAAFAHPTRLPDRVHLHGVQPRARLREFQRAAHCALEPFPFGSMTAMLENTVHGCQPILGPRPPSPILACAGDALEALRTRPASPTAWVDELTHQLADDLEQGPAERSHPETMRRIVIDHHQGEAWQAALAAIYQTLESTPHAIRRLAADSAERSVEDAVVSTFCLGSFGDDRSPPAA